MSGTVEIEIELARLNEDNDKMVALWASPRSSSTQEPPIEPN